MGVEGKQSFSASKIVLVRHLATANNLSKVIMGRSIDVDITQGEQVEIFEGKIKAIVAKSVVDSNNSDIFSSPLNRCLSTALIIKNVVQKNEPIVILDDLVETDMGVFEGQTGVQLRKKYPDLLDQWMYNPQNFQFPGGESYTQLSVRVRKVVHDLMGRELSDFTFICTHVDWIKMFLLEIQGRQFNERRSFDIPNGNIALLTKNNQQFEIISPNWNI